MATKTNDDLAFLARQDAEILDEVFAIHDRQLEIMELHAKLQRREKGQHQRLKRAMKMRFQRSLVDDPPLSRSEMEARATRLAAEYQPDLDAKCAKNKITRDALQDEYQRLTARREELLVALPLAPPTTADLQMVADSITKETRS